MATAFIALGSNLGDRAEHLRSAGREIDQLVSTRLVAMSSLHETEPLGPPQPKYLNAAAKIETDLEPDELLRQLLAIERRRGRERGEKWGPRTLDLDLLLYDDRVLKTDELTLPHPHLHERSFVLEPLREIAPDVVHPARGETVAQMAARLNDCQ